MHIIDCLLIYVSCVSLSKVVTCYHHNFLRTYIVASQFIRQIPLKLTEISSKVHFNACKTCLNLQGRKWCKLHAWHITIIIYKSRIDWNWEVHGWMNVEQTKINWLSDVQTYAHLLKINWFQLHDFWIASCSLSPSLAQFIVRSSSWIHNY